MNMNINYWWSMPNKQTFEITKINEYLKNEKLHYMSKLTIDPFANRKHEFASITNDINPGSQTHYNLDAIEFLNKFEDNSIPYILFDPPYSLRQLKECYDGFGKALTKYETTSYFSDVKDLISRKLKPGGYCYSFGWSSVGLGKTRGMQKIELSLICHGGYHNDTIILKEVKS